MPQSVAFKYSVLYLENILLWGRASEQSATDYTLCIFIAERTVPNGRIRDSGDMMAATATDPAYYIVNNILSVVPEPSNSNNAHVQTLAYPAVSLFSFLNV